MSESLEQLQACISSLRRAARDGSQIAGLTHRFYRYPARFSPSFAAAAISQFSQPGDLVYDPYMGGGTTLVEALRLGRHAVGSDVNALAAFVTRVKTTPISDDDAEAAINWIAERAFETRFHDSAEGIEALLESAQTRNLSLPRARPIKKLIALLLHRLHELPSDEARAFVRCAILNAAQWALNGRLKSTSLAEFRSELVGVVLDMHGGILEYREALHDAHGETTPRPHIIHDSAARASSHEPFIRGTKAQLIVTSPPYPGIHILYHRWQVDGRRETPAPYWITATQDGQGGSFYNFGDNRLGSDDAYFASSLVTLRAIREVAATGAVMIQMISFSDPRRQLRRYLSNMQSAGFSELRTTNSEGEGLGRRIWRDVPRRAWHASYQGRTTSSREVVLVHVAD